MIELTTNFIISQILVFGAIIFDFLSFQFKERKKILFLLIISATLISAHYFFLGKIVAGLIVCVSVIRFITAYHSTDKRFIYLFILLNTIVLIFTFSQIYDLIIYIGLIFIIIGNFQKDDRKLRLIMMVGTFLVMVYNIVIFTPMGVIAEGLFLTSNLIGYYRHYLKR